MSNWSTRLTADGSPTLVRASDGACMHSADGAWTQACLRYAAPVIAPRARAWKDNARPFRLLDIGTGSGLNLAAALAYLEPYGIALEATCLDLDDSGARATQAWDRLPARPIPTPVGPRLPDWTLWHPRVRSWLAELERPVNGRGRVRRILGDARDTLPRLTGGAAFHGVFLDPFAPALERDLWEADFVAEVAQRMARGARLATYSSSLRVRVALVAAGLEVGRGQRVGGKAQGTLASRGAPGSPWWPLESRTQAKLGRRLARKIEASHPDP